MQVAVVRCDACGKLLDEPKEVHPIDKMEFCMSCISENKREVENYIKNMGANIRDDKAAAFIVHSRKILTTHAINEIRDEEAKKLAKETAGFSK